MNNNDFDVPADVQMRVLGFAPTDETWIRIVTDPAVNEVRMAVTQARGDCNIFAPQYKRIPIRSENAHKDPANIICDDAACTFAIVGKMSVEERAALRARVQI
jgi:hypothetical protein